MHPGQILQTEFLTPLGITAYALAKTMNVTQSRVSEILRGQRRITAETAVLLAQALDTSEMFWVNLQARHTLETARIRNATNLVTATHPDGLMELEEIERAAGLGPDSPHYRLVTALATADDDLMEELVRIRKAKGLSVQDVARRMRQKPAAVVAFETLSSDPHMSAVRKYAAAIGASISHQVTADDYASDTG